MIDRLFENMVNADRKSYSKRLDKKSLDRNVFESSIDFPREGLDSAIWTKNDNGYILREDVKRKILSTLEKYSDVSLLKIAKEIRIVGSIATNQFLDNADLDIHVISRNPDDWSEKDVKLLMNWFNEHRDEIDGWVNDHPIEVYIQLNPAQDLMSDGCYSVLEDKWLVGPKIVSMSTDPYDDFSHIADDIRDAVEDADKLFSELKRDVIDYEVIKQAMEGMPGEDKKRLLQKLRAKLEELEVGIEALYKERGEWVDARHTASKPETPEQALKDVELAKNWKDVNATFKFINRYQYLKTINNLEKLLADEKISSKEVPIIKNIMGMQ